MAPEVLTEPLENGKEIQFLKTNDMIGVNYGVIDDLPACDRFFNNLKRICVSPAVFSFLADQETRSSIYDTLWVKDGDQMNMLMHYISGEL